MASASRSELSKQCLLHTERGLKGPKRNSSQADQIDSLTTMPTVIKISCTSEWSNAVAFLFFLLLRSCYDGGEAGMTKALGPPNTAPAFPFPFHSSYC